MQEQPTPFLKVSPQGSQSHFPSPSAALSSTRGTKKSSPKHLQKGLMSSAKHKVTVLLQLYQLKKFNSEVTRIPFNSPNLPSPEKQPTPKRNHYSSRSPTTDGLRECVAILVTVLTGRAKCLSDPSPLSSSQVHLELPCSNTSSTAFPKETKTGSSSASLKIAVISCVRLS